MTDAPRTWHYGLVARWWAEFNTARPEELAYYRGAIERFGQPALDLACGTGRVMLPLMAEGLDVDGIDISEDMLSHARTRGAAQGLRPTLLRQAMHELDAPRRYRTVYICDSFGIGGSRENDREALRRIHRALEPGGALLISHDLPYADERPWSYWLPGGRTTLPEPWPHEGGRKASPDGTELDLRTRLEDLDPMEQRMTLGMQARQWRADEVLAMEEMRIDIALYFRQELVAMVSGAGFDPVEVEGYYTGEPATANAASVVVVAHA